LMIDDFMRASPKKFSRNYFCGESLRRGQQSSTVLKNSTQFLSRYQNTIRSTFSPQSYARAPTSQDRTQSNTNRWLMRRTLFGGSGVSAIGQKRACQVLHKGKISSTSN